MTAVVYTQSESSAIKTIKQNSINVTEPMIAVNPTDPNNFIVVYSNWVNSLDRNPGSSRTTDGGLTWSSTEVPENLHEYIDQADPVVAFDAAGNAHYCYLDDGLRRNIMVAHSTDKGATWSSVSTVYDELDPIGGYPKPDKPWIIADCSEGPNRNTIYVVWTAIFPTPSTSYKIFLSYKGPNDNSFSDPIAVSSLASGRYSVQGAFPVVGNDGTLYIFWSFNDAGEIEDEDDNFVQIMMRKFEGQNFISDEQAIKWGIPNSQEKILGGAFHKAHSWPFVVVNPVDGSLNLVYGSYKGILFSRSTNGGNSWSTSSSKGMQLSGITELWNPMITCDSKGKLAIVYYATTGVPSNTRIYVAAGQATDNEFTVWTQGSVTFDPTTWRYTDYIGIACNDYTYWGVYPAPAGSETKIVGKYRTIGAVVENLDQDYIQFNNSKIYFDTDDKSSPYSTSVDLFPGKTHTLEIFSNQLIKNGDTYTFYQWEDEEGSLISTDTEIQVKIDNHRYRAMFDYTPPLPPIPVTVNVKNEFKEPSGTLSNGGTVNIDDEDIENTENLPGQQVTRIFNKFEHHRFEAKQQSFGSYYRGFNPYPQFDNGGWRKDNLAIPGGNQPIISPAVQAGTYTAKYRNRYNVNVNGFASEVNSTVYDIASKQIWQYESDLLSAPPTQQFSGGFEGNFFSWTGGITANPRTVTLTNNTTLIALYKGHLVSDNSAATSGNNQRKLAVSGSTKHLVYTSMDDIWYSRNTGSRWSNEMRVEGDAKNPSVHSIGSFVYIVWETDMGGGERRISFRKSTNSGATWGGITDWTVYTDGFDATPVIAGGSQIYNRIVVVWRQSNGLYICKPEVSTTGALIPNTTYQSELPSLAEDYNGYSLAYKNGSTIYHRGFTINPAGTITYEGSSPVTISTSGCTNPSVSRMWVSQSVSNIAVAYERVVSGYSRIGFKNKNASGWQSAVEIIEDPNQLTQPSVCYDQASGKIHLFLNYNSSVAHSMRDINSGSWEPISVLGSGNAPQLPSYSNSGPVTALWTSGSNAPYSINISEIQSVSGPISSNTTWSGYVNVTGNVTVNAGATLEILPGTAIAFASGTSLIVNGILDATGTSDERITFTSPHWVKVQNGNSIFKYCTFENAYYGLYLDGVSSGNPTIIEHCIFRDNATGLRFRNSNLAKVKSCQMYDNSYSGVFCDNSDVDFTGNQIYNNVLSGVGSTSGSLLQYYGNVIENNGRRGIYAASGDVVYIGKVYGWWGYNTIRYNNWDEVYAYSGNPHVEISGASIHDNPDSYVEVYNYPGNQVINAQSVWWDANCAQTSGNVNLMANIYCSLPTNPTPPDNWEGQPVTSGSPIGKAVANPLAGEIEWFLDPDIPDEDKIRIGKDIIAANPKSAKGKEALFWIYSIIRSDYREDHLREKNRFFDYLYNIQSKYQNSETGKLALQYMIIWKMLERDYSSVIEFCNEALEQFTGEERKSVLTELVFTYIHNGQIGKAKVALQKLQTRYSIDEETIALIEWDIADVENQIADGSFKPNKSLVSEASVPKEFELFSNYPNPFNPSTTIAYALPYLSSVYLTIYDITGRLIKSFSIPSQSSGYQSIIWDGTNENGNAVSSGVYLYRISIKSLEGNETFVKTAKLMMLK
jgi:hypothetical protein